MSGKDENNQSGVELADQAVDAVLGDEEMDDQDLADALAKLSPEEAQMFVRALEITLRRRRILLFGYLSSLAILVVGMVGAIWVYGSREPGTFVGWVFLVPFAVVGLVLVVAGKLAKRGVPITSEAPSSEPQG